jgi:hypothetical protein
MADPVLALTVEGLERLQRSVWVVVDPRDAVTRRRVTVPLHVRLKDVTATPLAGRSGVYGFTDLNLPPASYTVQVQPLLANHDQFFGAEREFLLETIPVPAQPLKRNTVSVDLLPRPAYPFPDQTTLARGRLVKASDGTAVEGAQIFLILETVDEGRRGQTDERGAFVVFFPPTAPEDNAAAGLKDFTFELRFEIGGQPPLLIAAETVQEGSTFSFNDIEFPGI